MVKRKQVEVELIADKRGMLWDLLLYVPTVFALLMIGTKLWFSPNQTWSYLLVFLGTFFLLTGANRIAGRMLLLPKVPVALEASKKGVKLRLRNGDQVDLIKELRFFNDYSGKSFGISAMDLSGRRRQYVFHKGQFSDVADYKDVIEQLKAFS